MYISTARSILATAEMIDAHQHFWKLDRGDYGWLDNASDLLRRDFLPADLLPTLRRYGVERTIVVQAAPTPAETEYLLDLAAENDFIAGVVGWLDLESDEFVVDLERLKARPKFLGLRPMLQDIGDDRWILRQQVLEVLRHMEAMDVGFDILALPRHLPHVVEAVRQVPGLRAVVDHMSKPPIASGLLEPWKAGIAELAALPNIHCKLSGLVTEADHELWSVDDLRPCVEHVLDCFGPDRLIWGSDWPVCGLAGEYGEVLAASQLALPPHLRGDPGIFGDNAARFYRCA